jgi:hypothetical protein
MKRLPDWPARLAELMDTSIGKPFEWGVNDCVTFASAGVLAVTGEDVLKDLRGRWNTALGAGRVLHRLGGFVQAVTDRLGPATSAIHARRGDLVLFPDELVVGGRHGCLSVCFGTQCGAPGDRRMTFRSSAEGRLCWRVGET